MKRIVVGYDGSIEARGALDRAAEFAGNGGPVAVVSVAPVHVGSLGPEPLDSIEVEEHQRQLVDAREYLTQRGVVSQGIEGFGDPANVIAREARNFGADLIVVGSYDKNFLERLLFGSVSSALVRQAQCDVLVVRGGEKEVS